LEFAIGSQGINRTSTFSASELVLYTSRVKPRAHTPTHTQTLPVADPGLLNPHATYGISLVSAFYGPGIWGAWLLVLSSLTDHIFAVEREKEIEKSHIRGIDLNLATAFA